MLVVWKPVADPPINVTEGHLSGGAAADGGRYEVGVAVRWLGVDTKTSSGSLADAALRRVVVRHRHAAADETAKSTGLDVEPTEPVHLRQTALQRALGAVHVGSHVEAA